MGGRKEGKMPPLSIEEKSPASCQSGITFQRAAQSPPAVPGASARRQLPETTSSRAWGSFQTGQKQRFSSPVHKLLSMCMWVFRDLIHFSLKYILIWRGWFCLLYFDVFPLSGSVLGGVLNFLFSLCFTWTMH